jgi:hypothetical protein
MVIELNCTIKGCQKFMQPVLDTKSNKVFCSVCDGEQTASHFTKINLKTVGQIRKAGKSAYSVKCASCKWEAMPKVVNNQLACPQCSAAHKSVSKPFETLIREAIKKNTQDDNG